MMLLIFHAANNRYGLDAAQVVEIVPALAPRSVPHAPPEVAGLMDYRGKVVPVLDLSRLLTGASATQRLNTRIILTRLSLPDAAFRLIGLLAERVMQTVKISDQQVTRPALNLEQAPYLDGIVQDQTGMIQRINVSALLPPSVLATLTAPTGENG